MPPTKRKFTAAFLRNGLSNTTIVDAIDDYHQQNHSQDDSSCSISSVGSNDLDVVIPLHDHDEDEVESPPAANDEHVKKDESRVLSMVSDKKKVKKEDDQKRWEIYCSLAPVFDALDDSLYFDIAWQKTHPF